MGAQEARYDNVKDLASHPDPEIRTHLASNPKTPAEILYFLAEDVSPVVRRAVAENPVTPRQADTLLSRDSDYTVRCLLARKIVGAGLPKDDRSQLWRMGFTILETLARDTLVRVRQTLAEAIKDQPSAPRPIILELARDPEREVASPILRNSPVLTERDLVDIASGDAPDWAQTAIAERRTVEADVSEAIVTRGDVPAITHLLKNKHAVIDDRTIERVVDGAEKVVEWHEPLVARPSLPGGAIMKLACFVAAPLLTALRSRKGLDPQVATGIDTVAQSRGIDARKPPARRDDGGKTKNRAEHLFRKNRLTDEAVGLALETGDNDFVISALALRAGISHETAKRILESRSPRTVTSLCWKAGHSMRFALEVQKRISQILPSQLLNAHDGHEFPLSPDEMDFQLELVVES
ncbi:MAG: DUF2336 domain-containing protein [Myxococcota bacterium]